MYIVMHGDNTQIDCSFLLCVQSKCNRSLLTLVIPAGRISLSTYLHVTL